jgi:hypothetical protein
MELAGLLSNPRVTLELDRIVKAVVGQQPGESNECQDCAAEKPPQGQILRTIKEVLREHADGLQTYEVRSHVEKRLGRSLPKSTVKDALASNRVFERISKGRYRLKQ